MTYVFSVLASDPDGPSRVDAGETYGNEALLLVVADVGFANALKFLRESMDEKGFLIQRVIGAQDHHGFDPKNFPYSHDLEEMMRDAEANGVICACDGQIFPLSDQMLSGFTVGFADVFDPKRENEGQPYAGEIVAFVIKSAPHLALEGLALRCEAENLTLKGLQDVGDAVFADPEFVREILEIEGNQAILQRGQLVWGPVYAYENEEGD